MLLTAEPFLHPPNTLIFKFLNFLLLRMPWLASFPCHLQLREIKDATEQHYIASCFEPTTVLGQIRLSISLDRSLPYSGICFPATLTPSQTSLKLKGRGLSTEVYIVPYHAGFYLMLQSLLLSLACLVGHKINM